MFLSDKGRAQLKTKHGVNDLTQQLADLIANQAMNECAMLDRVWIADAPSTCAPHIKRRHKQFLGELLAFYYCSTEAYLRQNCPSASGDFLDRLAREVAASALRDPFLRKLPVFQGDLPDSLLPRYMRRINTKRSRSEIEDDPAPGHDLIQRTAADILREANLSSSVMAALEPVLLARLDWTSKELLGVASPQ